VHLAGVVRQCPPAAGAESTTTHAGDLAHFLAHDPTDQELSLARSGGSELARGDVELDMADASADCLVRSVLADGLIRGRVKISRIAGDA
jgi:hypothetical protein